MKLALIGFGNAGGKIVDSVLERDRRVGGSLCRSVLAVNSAETDLRKPTHIPEEKRILIGQTDDRVKGHGVGADPDLGAEVAHADLYEIVRAIDDVPIHDIDAFLIVAGLGGGTGSGGAAVLAQELRETYREPVYGLAILPSSDEGGRASYNAARAFPTFVEATENLLVFDNDVWRGSSDSIGGGYERTNDEITTRIYSLLSAGSVEGEMVSENAMDASDVRRTLGTGGISTIAYADAAIESTTRANRGLLHRLKANGKVEVDGAKKISGLVRRAVQSRLTLPASIQSAERSLIVISGPPEECSRKGLETARRWLEEQTGSVEVLAGDNPRPNANEVSATVLLSNVTDVPRISELQGTAAEAKQNIAAQAETRERDIQALISSDELEPVGG